MALATVPSQSCHHMGLVLRDKRLMLPFWAPYQWAHRLVLWRIPTAAPHAYRRYHILRHCHTCSRTSFVAPATVPSQSCHHMGLVLRDKRLMLPTRSMDPPSM